MRSSILSLVAAVLAAGVLVIGQPLASGELSSTGLLSAASAEVLPSDAGERTSDGSITGAGSPAIPASGLGAPGVDARTQSNCYRCECDCVSPPPHHAPFCEEPQYCYDCQCLGCLFGPGCYDFPGGLDECYLDFVCGTIGFAQGSNCNQQGNECGMYCAQEIPYDECDSGGGSSLSLDGTRVRSVASEFGGGTFPAADDIGAFPAVDAVLGESWRVEVESDGSIFVRSRCDGSVVMRLLSEERRKTLHKAAQSLSL